MQTTTSKIFIFSCVLTMIPGEIGWIKHIRIKADNDTEALQNFGAYLKKEKKEAVIVKVMCETTVEQKEEREGFKMESKSVTLEEVLQEIPKGYQDVREHLETKFEKHLHEL
jgi:uncharacterized protein YbaA (DUF1428 family)